MVRRRNATTTKLDTTTEVSNCHILLPQHQEGKTIDKENNEPTIIMPPKSATDVESGESSMVDHHHHHAAANSTTTTTMDVTKKPVDDDDDEDGTHNKRKAFQAASQGFKAVTACLLYSFCSVSMILVNKSLASSYNHLIVTPDGEKRDLNTLLVVFQAAAAVLFCGDVN